jgi:hypothetical protein
MKEITYQLLDYLKNLPKIDSSRFSAKSNKFLSKLFTIFIRGNSEFSGTNITKTQSIDQKKRLDNYIPDVIKHYIHERNPKKTHVQFRIRERTFDIFMYHFNGINQALMNQHIKRIFIWLFTATQYASLKCSQNMTINIYFTEIKKLLPPHKTAIQTKHANTAFTTSCNTSTEINIFREEEWFKVFIHETFHCLGLDFSEMNQDSANARILGIFPVSSDVRLFETYCEIWAELINAMFIAYLSTRHDNIVKMIEKTEKTLYYERLFSLVQCSKILRHFHLTYENLYKKNANSLTKYKEETQVLSYYILKCIYIFHINLYLDWCVSNNGETLNFKKTPQSINMYIGLLESVYMRPEFISVMQQFEKFTPPPKLSNTLRMSVFELV